MTSPRQPVPTSCSHKDAVLLLGRGGYSEAPAEQLDQMVNMVRKTPGYTTVIGAMVDHGSPSLSEALDVCAASSATRILVVPVFMPDDRNLSRWLSHIIQRWLQKRPKSEIPVVLADPLGDQRIAHEAVAKIVAETQSGKQSQPIVPRERLFGDPEWSLIPPHAYHVLICGGPRCTTIGSDAAWSHLSKRLDEESLDSVLVTRTGCLFPCNLGPTMVVYPEAIWYCGLTNDAVDRIVDEHFIGGTPVKEYARAPGPRPQKRPDGEL